MSNWQILVDFDGTIAVDDTTDLILERFARPGWQEIEAQWQAGEIGSRECMSRQVSLLDVSDTELDAFVAQLPIDPTFPRFAALCADLALPLTVVSDGLDRVVRATLRRHGLADLKVVTNRLVYLGARRWDIAFPASAPGCRSASGTCKCAAAARSGALSLLIGDGRSDQCAAEDVDFVFAKKSLLAFCAARGVPHQEFETFGDVAFLLHALVGSVPASRREPAHA